MRIMLIVNEFPPEKIAGTGMATQALAKHLAAHGHQVLVAVTTPYPPVLLDTIEPADYELIWMRPRILRGTGMLWRIWQAWQMARRFRPQIIQGQAVSCGLIAAIIGQLLHVPSICYAQGYDVYEASRRQQWMEIRWGCLWPDRLLAVTHHLSKRIKNVTGTTQVDLMPHAFVLPDSTLSRDTARKNLNLEHSQSVVLSVGRLETFKGHDVLLRAWPDFVKQYPNAHLWIIGNGSQLDYLQRQAIALGVGESVHFAGHLSGDEVHHWMTAADLFVLPSRSEPFGIVLLEAMAHGLPVVASNVGGIPEVVPAQGDALLIPADDIEALKMGMLDISSKKLAPSDANRRHAMQFEWSLQVVRFETIYNQLLGTHVDTNHP